MNPSQVLNLVVTGRFPATLVHFLTDRCNARCPFCFIDFGRSAQKKSPYTYLLLQPVATLLFWLSFPVGCWWGPWLVLLVIADTGYLLLIVIDAVRCSTKLRYVPMVGGLILLGNLLPGVGFILKAFHLLPSLQSFYRNDQYTVAR